MTSSPKPPFRNFCPALTPSRRHRTAWASGLTDHCSSTEGGNYNIVSDGIVAGSIQVPGSKLPIILMADAQTAGGYPKIATVISADLPLLGVRGSGRTIRFEAVSREEAENIRRAEHKRIQDIIQAIRPVAQTAGINLEALYNHNLIDGVVDAYA